MLSPIDYLEYRIKPGDSLSLIISRFYGVSRGNVRLIEDISDLCTVPERTDFKGLLQAPSWTWYLGWG